MSSERRHLIDSGLAVVAVLAATAPVWAMGWLRDDWLLLWRALEPSSAPPQAAGVFPRPVAEAAWTLATGLGGDSPWALHGFTMAAWWVYLIGLLRWHRAWGGRSSSSAVVVALLAVGHGALGEPRLWAAASNGVFASALGVWAAWLLGGRPAASVRPVMIRTIGGWVLLLAGILARADAVLWLIPVLVERRGFRRGSERLVAWLAVGALGLVLLSWMVSAGGGWVLRPADAGRLLRLLLLPWGAPLPTGAQVAAAGAGLLVALGLVTTGRPRGNRGSMLLATAFAVCLGGALVSWSAAGRYLLCPAASLALVLGGEWERARASDRPWIPMGLIALMLAVHLTGAVAGRSTLELLERSRRETALYQAVRGWSGPLPEPLVMIDPPGLGWRGGVGDLENVVSAAARRSLPVRRLTGVEAGVHPRPALAWRNGEWTWLR